MGGSLKGTQRPVCSPSPPSSFRDPPQKKTLVFMPQHVLFFLLPKCASPRRLHETSCPPIKFLNNCHLFCHLFLSLIQSNSNPKSQPLLSGYVSRVSAQVLRERDANMGEKMQTFIRGNIRESKRRDMRWVGRAGRLQ